ncbi:hypothetical protein QVD17_01358 [Tagetes erecta]|uniref:Uncharacterized protein n=1 Tax=Tagetes erecta TaxID=13708 RepID=A0AAD8L688_TARER|nr:hypothetical protein QVD17_01358 [Tagetes erecta]
MSITRIEKAREYLLWDPQGYSQNLLLSFTPYNNITYIKPFPFAASFIWWFFALLPSSYHPATTLLTFHSPPPPPPSPAAPVSHLTIPNLPFLPLFICTHVLSILLRTTQHFLTVS